MRTEELSSPPRMSPLLLKAVLTAPTRRGGDLPDTELVLTDVVADTDRLADYARVCGFRLTPYLPPTYPHILGFPLAMRLMTDSAFPFPLPGMVHAGNLITQHRAVPAEQPLTIRVRADSLSETDRGTEFVMRTEAYDAGEAVWQEESRYLRRQRKPKGGTSADKPTTPRASPPDPTAIWRVPGDIGRRYAGVSGDHNPIHLHPLTSKLAGFSRPIAHGMWTLARCLAALEGRLPDRYRVEVAFRRPISLPSTVGFRADRDGAGWAIGVHRRTGEKTYVTGAVTAL
ncbi:MAG: MaoC/PaaZ C-terminal domain-containing protein [Micromonosporaceae bacterium]